MEQKRLTFKIEDRYIENPERINGKIVGTRMCLNKLGELEDAEEKGLLLVLPFKVGDRVYRIWSCGKNGKSVAEFEVTHIDIDNLSNIKFTITNAKKGSCKNWNCTLSDIGKTVFLTQKEAKSKLQEEQ